MCAWQKRSVQLYPHALFLCILQSAAIHQLKGHKDPSIEWAIHYTQQMDSLHGAAWITDRVHMQHTLYMRMVRCIIHKLLWFIHLPWWSCAYMHVWTLKIVEIYTYIITIGNCTTLCIHGNTKNALNTMTMKSCTLSHCKIHCWDTWRCNIR